MLGEDGAVMRGAGDVLRWALGQSSLRVDRDRLAAALPALNGFLIDCVIDERVTPWEWLSANLLPLLPVSLVSGPRGLYPVVWRHAAKASDATFRLDLAADPSIERDGGVRVDSTTLYNDVTVSYCLDLRTDRYKRSARVGRFVESYARVVVAGFNDDRILVTARFAGARGDGIALSVASSGSGSGAGTTATEDVGAKTVDLDFEPAVTTTADVIDAINGTAQLRAELISGPGSRVWNDILTNPPDYQEYDYTLSLPQASAPGLPACDLSQRRYGVLPKTVETTIVYDDATAHAIASWMGRAYALPRRTIAYTVPREWGTVERGDIGTLTDPDLHLDDQVCLVQDVAVDGATSTLTLLFVEDPVRDRRLA